MPQGSVLGPLLYILFTNDLPEVIHDEHAVPPSSTALNIHCPPCRSLVNYVDDGTYSFASKDPQELSSTLTSKYKIITNYMESNKLVINADKTHLVVMGKKKFNNTRGAVQLVAGQHVITPSETEKLLGCHIHQSMKWLRACKNQQPILDKTVNKSTECIKKTYRKCSISDKTNGS